MSEPVFAIARAFDAPLALVWEVYSQEKHLAKWWGPKGFTWVSGTMDFRPGGRFHYCMRSPDGHEMWGKAVYREIAPPERLVYLTSFSDKDGNLTRHPLSATWPREMLTTFTFTEVQGRTTFTVTWLPYNSSAEETRTFDAARCGMSQGWTGSLDQLTEYLANTKS